MSKVDEKLLSDLNYQRKYFANHILEKFIKKTNSPKNELVIHIRSGDIFDSKLIHPKYGQPPLSFYILAINHFKPKSIILIRFPVLLGHNIFSG